MIALVTGASKGIGAACARALSEAGHQVALVARDEQALEAVARSLPGEAIVVPADLLDPAATEAAFTVVEREWGPVEILVSTPVRRCPRHWCARPTRTGSGCSTST